MTADAIARLRTIVPHLRVAFAMAKVQAPEGRPELGILSTYPDGASSYIAARLDAEGFVDDLERVLDAADAKGGA